MNIQLLSLIAFRIGALVLGQQGRSAEAAFLNAAITAVQAGRNVDAYLARFAALLGTADEPTLQALTAQMNAEVDEFLSRRADGTLPPEGGGTEPEDEAP